MILALADILARCPGAWHQLLSAGQLERGQLSIPDQVAGPILAACAQDIPATLIVEATPFFGGLTLADPATQADRLAVCQPCPSNVGGKCTKCPMCGGRPVTAKVRRADEFCPEGKWGKIPD